jgi:very-short-patch-repair endonuclease
VHGQTNQGILAPKLQRRLRNNMTDAERKLWQGLRGRQMEGFKFRRQHPYYDSILDFVCLEQKLVIEVDGGQHAGSVLDAARDGFLEKGGFRVLRFWNNDVLTQTSSVLDSIYGSLTKPHHPLPTPPLEGEGV